MAPLCKIFLLALGMRRVSGRLVTAGLFLFAHFPEAFLFRSTTVAMIKGQVAAALGIPATSINLGVEATPELRDGDSVGAIGLRNGDMLLATTSVRPEREEKEAEWIGLPDVTEHPVDQLLDKEDGWIQQSRDEKTCFRHPPNGSCVHCMPMPPWAVMQVEPWKSEKLKHMPFTGWLRKRDQGRGECRHNKVPGVFCQNCQPLTEEFYAAKKCNRHEPWPRGICSYCKPDSIRLVRQEYRHVDHVVFENAQVLGSLIEAWRQTGTQRCGFLFGRYELHKDVPLGIKAVVEAIYEPPQLNSKHGLQLQDDDDEANVVAAARELGLEMLGFAWTAIEVEGGKIQKSRDLDKTYLASGAEMLQAALFQNDAPSACRHSMTGKFGSKWLSVLVTGTAEGEIAPIVFQVSDQLAGMTRDGIVTTNPDPRFLQAVENEAIYVPKILYDDTNEYDRAVVKEANPVFPPVPCWVDVNFAAPKVPNPLLPTHTFPVENRTFGGSAELALSKQIHMSKPLTEVFGDFHFYLYLAKILDPETLSLVAHGIVDRNQTVLKEALRRIQPLLPDGGNTPSKPGGASKPSATNTGGRQKHPKEAEWIAQLAQMGFPEAQARSALERSEWQGIESALAFLLA